MAVSKFILAGMAISALFLAFFRLGSQKAALLASRILGVTLGLAMAWASNLIETGSNISPASCAVWIVLLFVAWGAALGWVYQRLRRDQVVTASGESAAASTAEGAKRRRFLARFAGIASVITVVAAAVGKVGGRGEAAAPTTRPLRHETTQLDRIHRGDRSWGTRLLGRARLGQRDTHESDLSNRYDSDEHDDCAADTGNACAYWRHRPCRSSRHIEVELRVDNGQWIPSGTASGILIT